MNYKIHSDANFTFNGNKYHTKDFENATLRAIEVYGYYANGMEKFLGYAKDLGVLGFSAMKAIYEAPGVQLPLPLV